MTDAIQFLEDKLSNERLFELMVQQLNKDFQLAVDSSIEFTSTTPSELVEEVYARLVKITSTSVSKFSSLLYRVDVSEVEVDAIKGVSFEEYLQQLTFLILKRIFQKVYFRNIL